MTKFRPLDIDKFHGCMSIEEHAQAVTDLLNNQLYNESDDNDLNTLSQTQLLLRLRKDIRDMEQTRVDSDYSPIHAGCRVTTKHTRFAPMGPKKRSRGVRVPVHGNVLEESEYFPGFWLVYIFSHNINSHFYLSCKSLRYVSSTAVTHQIGTNENNNNVASVPLDEPDIPNNRDLIMLCLLNDKVHRSVGYKNISVNEIVEMFQPKFQWITKHKIHDFIKKFRRIALTKKKIAKKEASPTSVVEKGSKSFFDEDTNDTSSTVTTDKKISCKHFSFEFFIYYYLILETTYHLVSFLLMIQLKTGRHQHPLNLILITHRRQVLKVSSVTTHVIPTLL